MKKSTVIYTKVGTRVQAESFSNSFFLNKKVKVQFDRNVLPDRDDEFSEVIPIHFIVDGSYEAEFLELMGIGFVAEDYEDLTPLQKLSIYLIKEDRLINTFGDYIEVWGELKEEEIEKFEEVAGCHLYFENDVDYVQVSDKNNV